MASPATPNTDAIAFRSISKSYGFVQALDDVTFSIPFASIYAIVGENGAGKSTLAKVLAGEVRADSGDVVINGDGPSPRDPRDASRRGVGVVHQEFLLAPSLTVWENIVMGWEGHPLVISPRASKARIRAVADRFGIHLPLDERLEDLPISLQQRVEILKSLYRGADILVLDEPTAVLTPIETRGLFDAMRQLRDQGKTLVFVSHKLKEVLAVADAIAVMRNGRLVATVRPNATTEQELASLIVGRELRPVAREPITEGEPALIVDNLRTSAREGSTGLRGCTFTAHRSEVLGIAGVSGNGQDDLVDALSGEFGAALEGSIDYPALGLSGTTPTVSTVRGRGLGYVPADRLRTATAPGEPLWFSAISGRLEASRFLGPMGIRRARDDAERIRTGFGVKAASVDVTPDQLSGGNLQKYIVGREITRTPQVLIAYEPTRGIDIGAARELRERLRHLAREGTAIILVSSDLDELLETSDRMLVLTGGVISADLDPTSASIGEIGIAMTSTVGTQESA